MVGRKRIKKFTFLIDISGFRSAAQRDKVSLPVQIITFFYKILTNINCIFVLELCYSTGWRLRRFVLVPIFPALLAQKSYISNL